MKVKLLSDELISVQPMSEKQYKKELERTEKELRYRNAVYNQTFIRRVLIEKYEQYSTTSLILYEG